MDLVAQIKQLKDRLDNQASVINEQGEALKHLTTLEENNAAMIYEIIAELVMNGTLTVREQPGLTVIDGGKK